MIRRHDGREKSSACEFRSRATAKEHSILPKLHRARILTAAAEELLCRMLSKIDTLCEPRVELKLLATGILLVRPMAPAFQMSLMLELTGT